MTPTTDSFFESNLYIGKHSSFDIFWKNIVRSIEGETNQDIDVSNSSVICPEIFTVQAIRDLVVEYKRKPVKTKFRYLVIYDFGLFNTQAQNAFLKTLEEHSGYIFLHNKSSDNILETILSRVVTEDKSGEIEFHPNEKLLVDIESINKTRSLDLLRKSSKEVPKIELLENIQYYFNQNGELSVEDFIILLSISDRATQPVNLELQLSSFFYKVWSSR